MDNAVWGERWTMVNARMKVFMKVVNVDVH